MNAVTHLLPMGLSAALVLACGPATASSTTTPSPTPKTLVSGVYVYQPAPLIWELVTIADGEVAGGVGEVFEWNCAGQRWAMGAIPARTYQTYLQFGDDRFTITRGALDEPWRAGADPRSLPKPVCAAATPTTKALLSADAARELIKGKVTAIAPVLVPTVLPDRVSATVDTYPSSFAVTYVAPDGIRLTLLTVVASPRPVQTDGTQRRLTFRSDTAAFYQALDGRAKTMRTLLWSEPATDASRAGSASCGCTPYSLTADGLTEPEFWQIAESLR